MKRRDFLATTIVTGTVAAVLGTRVSATETNFNTGAQAASNKGRFKLRYAPHFGMFREHAGYTGNPNEAGVGKLIDELKFCADEGFTAFEDNGMRGRPVEVQEQLAREMTRLGMEMGIFVANDRGLEKGVAILTSGDENLREGFLKNIRESVEVAKRVNTKRVTLVVGNSFHRLQHGYQTANAIEALKRASDICEPSGLVMVCEPLNIYRDHPEFFVSSNAQMYALMKGVGSPSCKVLYDIYHTQVNEGNIIPNMDRCWDEVAYIQTGDHPGRKEPFTGEINYKNVFRHVYNKGYKGILGMEHGNSKPGKAGERAVIDAYAAADSFEIGQATEGKTK